jgi:Ca2+-binding EF-hand superfamily protein
MSRSTSANSLHEILFTIKMQLKHKGQNSAKNLLQSFQQSDADSNGTLDREEFESLLTRCGIFLSRMDITYLMRNFDSNS